MQRRSSLQVTAAMAAVAFGIGCGDAATDWAQVSQELVVYRVGPGQQYPDLKAVAPLLNPGDVVEVMGNATYSGDIRLTRHGNASNKITIRGVAVNGKRPLLSGGTNTVEVAANHYVLDGFEITGGSFRCVFHHGHDVTIRNTVIHDCPAHGILGAETDSGSLTLEYSEIYRTGNGDRQHQIYMATDETKYPGSVFRMQHCYVHDGNGGNNIKSRSERNEIYHNWIEGAYYHELELIGAEGHDEALAREDSDVVGNVLVQRRSHYPIRFGGDGTAQTWGRYRFINNTVVLSSSTASAVFRLFDGLESVEMHNNVFYRQGGGAVNMVRESDAVWSNGRRIAGSRNWVTSGSSNVPSEWQGTLTGSDPGFTNLTANNLVPLSSSVLRDAGASSTSGPPGYAFPSPLARPAFEPARSLLAAARPRNLVGAIDIGAFEYGSPGTAPVAQPTPTPTTPPEPEPPSPSTGEPVTLEPVADTMVRGGTYGNRVFGAWSYMTSKHSTNTYWARDAYFTFDVSSVDSVSKAKLRIYAGLTEQGSVRTAVHPARTTRWSETSMTWNNRVGFEPAALDEVTVSGTQWTWYELDVSAHVRAAIAAGANEVGLVLHNPVYSTPRIDMNTREAPGKRPQLVVTP